MQILRGGHTSCSCCASRPRRLRERDSNWLVQNPLLQQANRRPDFVLWYEANGEKCILQPYRELLKRPHQILRGEIFGKIRGILAGFGARGTACLNLMAEGEELGSNILQVDRPAQNTPMAVQSPKRWRSAPSISARTSS
jgi:hypothetical protein